jgi:transcriptional repressor NrdR
MKCPFCQKTKSKVVDKRDNSETGVTRRRRECLFCTKRFTTYERIENINLNVIKKSGSIEEFDREKLKRGILKAVKKRHIQESQLDELIEDIELKLLNRKNSEIKSTEIGDMVLNRLKKIDAIAYLLFAAVYKDFNSIKDIENEILTLKETN